MNLSTQHKKALKKTVETTLDQLAEEELITNMSYGQKVVEVAFASVCFIVIITMLIFGLMNPHHWVVTICIQYLMINLIFMSLKMWWVRYRMFFPKKAKEKETSQA